MGLSLQIPERGTLALDYLLVDVNGTLTNRGEIVAGVPERLAEIQRLLEVRFVSADTFGTLEALAETLGARAEIVTSGAEKAAVAEALGAGSCAAIGNGANDAAMLRTVALGIAVVGPEGVSGEALRAADVVCASIGDALDLLLDGRALVATLRG